MGRREGEENVRSKARLVDPIVDVVVCPFICPLNLCSQLLREKVNTLILFRQNVIELCVEHADDFAGLDVCTISSGLLFSAVEDEPHC